MDYDRPRAVPRIKQSSQMTTEEQIRALSKKDDVVEVARVPTHILDSMLHAEPVDDVIIGESVPVTRRSNKRHRAGSMRKKVNPTADGARAVPAAAAAAVAESSLVRDSRSKINISGFSVQSTALLPVQSIGPHRLQYPRAPYPGVVMVIYISSFSILLRMLTIPRVLFRPLLFITHSQSTTHIRDTNERFHSLRQNNRMDLKVIKSFSDHLMPMDYGRIRPADPMTGRPRDQPDYYGPPHY
ncbi:hypothetical protein PRIPAC_92169 [Pristionchus pacificus]|uniref:Uncharacterized protein n=1 Tax=Pristionchus pacificus TaxID=54126 RepID=A0A2A6BAK5_PRIPA|nr:hypothetical protein PRIPAC_92169 [Pristionchus pacificus]|eukprot:PDM62912.1 hypothetical protein PRIPAC_50127 [Pristionchus pacificus]